MSKKTVSGEKLEIIVSTYWPTTILKSVEVIDVNTNSMYKRITLSASDAHYLYEQLKSLFEKSDISTGEEEGLQQ